MCWCFGSGSVCHGFQVDLVDAVSGCYGGLALISKGFGSIMIVS